MLFKSLLPHALGLFFVMAIPASYAAPAMQGPTCSLEGKVESVTERTEEYKDDLWRKSWDLSKDRKYTDIRLAVIKSSLVETGMSGETCSPERLGKVTFQLREGEIRLKVGDNIRAMTKFSGDEFSIGQWLYDVKTR